MRIDTYRIIEIEIPQARTPEEAEALWAIIRSQEVRLEVGWCPVCCKTKNFDEIGCLTCGWNTTMRDYDASFPARH